MTPGYAGGDSQHPTYEQVSMGTTGHAEVILIEYDSVTISFTKLLEVFFELHDPTTLNRQGADVGTQYRSIILYANEEQEKEAKETIEKLKQEKPVVTEVLPLTKFYPAEEYHKNYYARHPHEGYSEAVIEPKMKKLRSLFSGLLK